MSIIRHFWVFFLLFNCSRLSIAEIRRGQYIEKAVITSVDEFLQQRMKNSIKKVLGYNTEVLFEDKDFVYYGYVQGSERESLYVEELKKVSKSLLNEKFPGYLTLTGIEIKREITSNPIFSITHKSILLQNYDYRFKLTEEGLVVWVDWRYTKDSEKEVQKLLKFILDPKTGKNLLPNN